MALLVSCNMRTWAQMYLGLEKKGTVHALATLAWDSPSFFIKVIRLLFGIISGINEGV